MKTQSPGKPFRGKATPSTEDRLAEEGIRVEKVDSRAKDFAQRFLDRVEAQERPGLSIWANSPANVHDLAALLTAFARDPDHEQRVRELVEDARRALGRLPETEYWTEIRTPLMTVLALFDAEGK